MKHEAPGSIIGGILLIAGSCIGAGMLGLPILTGLCGFYPSLIILTLAWLFMTFTALLLIEINGWFLGQVNIISMAEQSIGITGKIISWVLYLFLFYSLLVAYIASSGKIFSNFLNSVFLLNVSDGFASLFFIILFGVIVYFGTKPVDFFNRALMIGLIVAYVAMITIGLNKVSVHFYSYVNWKYFLIPLPVLITSFGFHNMIPSLTAYMKGNLKRTKYAILGGSLLSLFVYLFWIIFVLGVVPIDGQDGLYNSYVNGIEATIPLRKALQSTWIGAFSQSFAFFAIITSFLAQSLGLMHFIADGFKVEPNNKNNWWLILLTLIPPAIFAFSYPTIFFNALSFAGGFCAVILFGILPVIMAWIGRYKQRNASEYHLCGGKFTLALLVIFSLIVIYSELISFF